MRLHELCFRAIPPFIGEVFRLAVDQSREKKKVDKLEQRVGTGYQTVGYWYTVDAGCFYNSRAFFRF